MSEKPPANAPGDELTEKQKLGCYEFIKDLNGTQSLIRAGYSKNYAERKQYLFFQNEKVQDYITHLQKKRSKKTGITPEEIVRRLLRISERAERDDELPSAIRALELLGKHQAMFTDKQIITEEKNPWSTGDDQDSINKDVDRLRKIAAPKLKVVNGGRTDSEEE